MVQCFPSSLCLSIITITFSAKIILNLFSFQLFIILLHRWFFHQYFIVTYYIIQSSAVGKGKAAAAMETSGTLFNSQMGKVTASKGKHSA